MDPLRLKEDFAKWFVEKSLIEEYRKDRELLKHIGECIMMHGASTLKPYGNDYPGAMKRVHEGIDTDDVYVRVGHDAIPRLIKNRINPQLWGTSAQNQYFST